MLTNALGNSTKIAKLISACFMADYQANVAVLKYSDRIFIALRRYKSVILASEVVGAAYRSTPA